MSGDPFLIASPRDMLTKAERELLRLRESLNTDTVFNFFVSAYHVMDYVKALGTVSSPDISAMYADADFDMCRFICNRGKHLVVTRDPKVVTTDYSGGDGCLGFGSISEGAISESPEWHLFCDGMEVRPIELAQRLIAKWNAFFLAHGIP